MARLTSKGRLAWRGLPSSRARVPTHPRALARVAVGPGARASISSSHRFPSTTWPRTAQNWYRPTARPRPADPLPTAPARPPRPAPDTSPDAEPAGHRPPPPRQVGPNRTAGSSRAADTAPRPRTYRRSQATCPPAAPAVGALLARPAPPPRRPLQPPPG